ncbi:MAG: hypothetical protein IPP07_15795 [Holophagales bacterium]|nr:hypothetical protein [Holophagales bacterium]
MSVDGRVIAAELFRKGTRRTFRGRANLRPDARQRRWRRGRRGRRCDRRGRPARAGRQELRDRRIHRGLRAPGRLKPRALA